MPAKPVFARCHASCICSTLQLKCMQLPCQQHHHLAGSGKTILHEGACCYNDGCIIAGPFLPFTCTFSLQSDTHAYHIPEAMKAQSSFVCAGHRLCPSTPPVPNPQSRPNPETANQHLAQNLPCRTPAFAPGPSTTHAAPAPSVTTQSAWQPASSCLSCRFRCSTATTAAAAAEVVEQWCSSSSTAGTAQAA